MTQLDAAKIALRVVRGAATVYSDLATDIFSADRLNDFRHESLMLRLRCQKDDAPYKRNRVRNKLEPDNSLSRLYFLQCSVCAEPLEIKFPLLLPSELQKRMDRQEWTEPPEARTQGRGVDR